MMYVYTVQYSHMYRKLVMQSIASKAYTEISKIMRGVLVKERILCWR